MPKTGRPTYSETQAEQRAEARAPFAEALSVLREILPPGADRDRAELRLKQALAAAYAAIGRGALRPVPQAAAAGDAADRDV